MLLSVYILSKADEMHEYLVEVKDKVKHKFVCKICDCESPKIAIKSLIVLTIQIYSRCRAPDYSDSI